MYEELVTSAFRFRTDPFEAKFYIPQVSSRKSVDRTFFLFAGQLTLPIPHRIAHRTSVVPHEKIASDFFTQRPHSQRASRRRRHPLSGTASRLIEG